MKTAMCEPAEQQSLSAAAVFVCLRCGEPAIETSRQGPRPKFCSGECRNRWWAKRNGPRKERLLLCQVCGTEFHSTNRAKKCCSPECALKARTAIVRKRTLCTCKCCGDLFMPKSIERITYCSRECAFAAKKALAEDRAQRERERQSVHTHTQPICSVCGCALKEGSKAKRCDNCRKQIANSKAYARSAGLKRLEPRPCRECQTVFVPEYGNKRRHFCSQACGDKYGKRVGRAMRRAMIRKVKRERIDWRVVCERDGWRCRLCGIVTPKHLRGTNDDRAPEIDHAVPLSLGGPHTYGNVQLLCRLCNQIKGDRTMDELRVS